MDYVFILFFVFASTMMLYIHERTGSKGNKRIICLLFISFSVLFCGLRSVIPNIPNSDAYEYYRFYQLASESSFKEYLLRINQSEILFYAFFWLSAKWGLNYSVVRTIYYIILSAVSVKLLSDLDTKGNRCLDYCILSINLVLSYCLMRNCMGYVFGWYAIVMLQNNKIKKSIIVSLIGCFIHSSCVVVLAFCFFTIGISIIKRLYVLIVFIVACFGIVSWGLPHLLVFLGGVNSKIAYYNYINEGSFSVLTNMIRISILLLLLFLFDGNKMFLLDKNYKTIFLLTCFSLMIIPAQLVNGIAYRFLPYFDMLNIIAFGYFRRTTHLREIVIGNIKFSNVMFAVFNVAIVLSFTLQSLTGYGLIPIKW